MKASFWGYKKSFIEKLSANKLIHGFISKDINKDQIFRIGLNNLTRSQPFRLSINAIALSLSVQRTKTEHIVTITARIKR